MSSSLSLQISITSFVFVMLFFRFDRRGAGESAKLSGVGGESNERFPNGFLQEILSLLKLSPVTGSQFIPSPALKETKSKLENE